MRLDVRRTLLIASLACLVSACGERDRTPEPGALTPADSASMVSAALDTLRRLGASDYVVDSLVRHDDSPTVWAGPRAWMATDRPTSAVTVTTRAKVVAIRHVLGG